LDCLLNCKLLLSVAFEIEPRLSRLKKLFSYSGGLRIDHLPGDIQTRRESRFSRCQSLASLTFKIHGQRGVSFEVLAHNSSPCILRNSLRFLLCGYKSLPSVPFETGSRLSRLANSAFSWSGLRTIHLPARSG
jgi:hypothetical protein